jgi:hypothetical protein
VAVLDPLEFASRANLTPSGRQTETSSPLIPDYTEKNSLVAWLKTPRKAAV